MMVFILRLLFITVCFILPALKGFCQLDTTKQNEFEIGPDFFASSFKAHENADNDSEKRNGLFEGLFVADTFRPYNQQECWINVFHVDVHGDYGNAGYKFPSDGDVKVKSVNNYIVEPRVWAGKDFDLGSYLRLTPYMGFGYRWYYEQLKNKTIGAGVGGNTQTQYFYLPVGTDLTITPSQGWRVSLNGEYDYMFWGKVANYSPSSVIYGDSYSNTLRKGYGLRFGLKLVKEFDTVNLFVEPYFRYWDIGKSNTVKVNALGVQIGTNQEAANKTAETGVRFGVEF